MKKIFTLSLLAVMTGISAFSQSFSDVEKAFKDQKYPQARTAVDKYLAVEKNVSDAEAWYYKGRIYQNLSFDSTLPKSEVYTLRSAAFEAFKKNQQLDSKDLRLKLEDYGSYRDLYYGFYDLAANSFNAKDFDASFESFKKASEVKDYIVGKNYTYADTKFLAFDTSLTINTAVAAAQAKKVDDAVLYYSKLADKNVAGPDYIQVYAFLVDHYAKAKDQAKFDAIITKARGLYPGDPYWDETELSLIPRAGDKTQLYAKYDDLIAKNPTNYSLAYNYAVEYYNSLYGNDVKPKDEKAAKQRLTEVLKGAITNDKGIDATVIMANHLYNVAADYSSAASLIKGTKPEDVKKKAELRKQATAAMDEVVPYAQAALKYFAEQPKLKATQHSNQTIMIDYLIDIYSLKGDKAKVAEFEKLKTTLK